MTLRYRFGFLQQKPRIFQIFCTNSGFENTNFHIPKFFGRNFVFSEPSKVEEEVERRAISGMLIRRLNRNPPLRTCFPRALACIGVQWWCLRGYLPLWLLSVDPDSGDQAPDDCNGRIPKSFLNARTDLLVSLTDYSTTVWFTGPATMSGSRRNSSSSNWVYHQGTRSILLSDLAHVISMLNHGSPHGSTSLPGLQGPNEENHQGTSPSSGWIPLITRRPNQLLYMCSRLSLIYRVIF